MSKEITYLASAYSSKFYYVRESRYTLASQAMLYLLLEHQIGAYSPIAHWHPIATEYGLPEDYVYWKEYDRRMISLLDSLTVLRINDWEESKGLADELEYAQLLKKPIRWIRLVDTVTVLGKLKFRFELLD